MTKQQKDIMADEAAPNASDMPVKKNKTETVMVDPESLIADLSRPQMFRMLTYALLIHILIILITSVGFISLCVKYHSMHPRQVIRVLDREAAEKKMKEDAAKAAADAVRAAKTATEEAGRNAKVNPAPANAAETGAPPAVAAAGASSGQPAEKKKSKIEQEVEKTSSERPAKPTVSLDMTPDLE